MSVFKELGRKYYAIHKQMLLPFRIIYAFGGCLNIVSVLSFAYIERHPSFVFSSYKLFIFIAFVTINVLFSCLFLNLKSLWCGDEIRQLRSVGMTIEEVGSVYTFETLQAIKSLMRLLLPVGTLMISIYGLALIKNFMSFLKMLVLYYGLSFGILLIMIIDLNIIIKDPKEKSFQPKHQTKSLILRNNISHFGKINAVFILLLVGIVGSSSVLTFERSLSVKKFMNATLKCDYAVTKVDPLIVPSFDSDEPLSKKEILTENQVNTIKHNSTYQEGGEIHCCLDKSVGLNTKKLPHKSPVTGDVYPSIGKNTYSFNLYGCDFYVLRKMKILSGHIDEQKLKTGRYIIYALDYDRHTLLDYDGVNHPTKRYFNVGDDVTITKHAKKFKYKIMAIALMNPTVSEYRNVDNYGTEVSFYLPLNAYKRISHDQPRRLIFNTKGKTDKLRSYLSSQQLFVTSNQSVKNYIHRGNDFYESIGLIAYLIFFLIGMLYFAAFLAVDIYAHRNDIAILRSLGMTQSQLHHYLTRQNITYSSIVLGGITLIYFCVNHMLRVSFHHTVILSYTPVYWPICLAILLTFISNFIVTIYSIKKIDINRIKK